MMATGGDQIFTKHEIDRICTILIISSGLFLW